MQSFRKYRNIKVEVDGIKIEVIKIKSVKKFYEISQWTPAELKRFEDLAKDESRIHICYGKPPF